MTENIEDSNAIEVNVIDEDVDEKEISRVNIFCCIKPNDRNVSFGSYMLFATTCVFWISLLQLFLIIGAATSFIYTAYLIGTDPQQIVSKFTAWIGFFALYSYFVYKILIKKIPRFCCGKRRFTKSHKHSLVSILRTLYTFIPNEESLRRIDEKARENIIIAQKVMEKELQVEEMELFMAGSTSERFNLPVSSCWFKTEGVSETSHAMVSDFDYMISPTAEKASFTSERDKYLVITDYPKLQPGFVHLHDNESGKLIAANVLKKDLLGVTRALKVRHFQGFKPTRQVCFCCAKYPDVKFANAKIKGPAIELSIGTDVNLADSFYSDLTFSVKCLQWPDTVSDWTYRPDKKWPHPYDVARIASLGCHIVPKSQPDDEEELSWRISFSRAEVELSKLIPPTARMCLIGLKIIAKDYLSVACSRISSYQLKSLLLYAMEKTDPQFWLYEENLEQRFHLLFGNLPEAVINKYCPHFGIPEINLFVDLEDWDIKKLTKVLRKILKSPQRYIDEFKPLGVTQPMVMSNENVEAVA